MVMMSCAECGYDVSSTARSCPHCGANFVGPALWQDVLDMILKLMMYFGWFILIVIAVLVFLALV